MAKLLRTEIRRLSDGARTCFTKHPDGSVQAVSFIKLCRDALETLAKEMNGVTASVELVEQDLANFNLLMEQAKKIKDLISVEQEEMRRRKKRST